MQRSTETGTAAHPSHLVGGHGRVVLHPLLHDLDHRPQDLGVRLLDERREDDLDEVLPHLHVHDGQPRLHQVQAQHDQLTRHYGNKREREREVAEKGRSCLRGVKGGTFEKQWVLFSLWFCSDSHFFGRPSADRMRINACL